MGRHTIDENRELVAGFTGRPCDVRADIRLGPIAPEYHAYAARMLRHMPRPLLGIHAGCTIYKGHTARRWPVERFAELCERADQELGVQPVLFGMPDEIELKLAMQAACPQAFIAHGPSIRHTAAMIARCSAFVSNDSGLAHIASALNVPVVMICWPTASWSIRPYLSSGRVVEAGLSCSPCFLVGRKPVHCSNPTYQACLKAIGVSQVLRTVEACLGEIEREKRATIYGHGCIDDLQSSASRRAACATKSASAYSLTVLTDRDEDGSSSAARTESPARGAFA